MRKIIVSVGIGIWIAMGDDMLGGLTHSWPLWLKISVMAGIPILLSLMWIREIFDWVRKWRRSDYSRLESREIKKARARKVASDLLRAEEIVRAWKNDKDPE